MPVICCNHPKLLAKTLPAQNRHRISVPGKKVQTTRRYYWRMCYRHRYNLTLGHLIRFWEVELIPLGAPRCHSVPNMGLNSARSLGNLQESAMPAIKFGFNFSRAIVKESSGIRHAGN